jgi:hypothetical protein
MVSTVIHRRFPKVIRDRKSQITSYEGHCESYHIPSQKWEYDSEQVIDAS